MSLRRMAIALWIVAGLAVVWLAGHVLLTPVDPGPEPMPALATTAVIEDPATHHAYRFIAARNISWNAAALAARRMRWQGHAGYLATITSDAEWRFVKDKVFAGNYSDVTYLGGRQVAPREWRWVTGPEGREEGGRGRLFWSGDERGHVENASFATWQQPAFQHGGRWDARKVCCVTMYSYGFPQFSTSNGDGYWEEGVAGYLVEFGG
jgi:hypothetical protein